MPSSLSPTQIAHLLTPYLDGTSSVPERLYDDLASYLDLLLKWNARTNLTAIRDPEEIVRRHFGESLFAARHLGSSSTLLDFGSGAGFPGLPIQLLLPKLAVTLAESQNKKSTFLREAVRTLGLKTEVWSGRVEAMPSSRRFDVVTLRAVDQMDAAIAAAAPRSMKTLLLLTTARQIVPELPGFPGQSNIQMPGGFDSQVVLLSR